MKSVAESSKSRAFARESIKALVRVVSGTSREANLARQHLELLEGRHAEAHRQLWDALSSEGLVGKRVVIDRLIIDTTDHDRIQFLEATVLDEVAS